MSKVDLFVHTSLPKIGHFTCILGWCPVSYIVLFNKCINENIAVLNNEIMSFKMGSKGPLSLKTNP